VKVQGGKYRLILCAALCTLSTAHAADREGFFGKDTARDMLPDTVLKSDIPGIEFFPAPRAKQEEPEAQVKEEAPADGSFAVKPVSLAQPNKPLSKEEQAQAILAKYGDPQENAPVLAKDDAPRPLKALMEAKEAGNDELAFQYARQYVRFLRSAQDRTLYNTGLLGKAMIREGILPENSWAKSDQFGEQQRLLEKDQAKAKAAESEAQLETGEVAVQSLDDETKDMLERAKAAEDYPSALNKKDALPEAPVLDERTERLKIQANLRGKVPLAKDGKLDIFLFVRPFDMNSRSGVANFEKLYRSYSGDSKINFVAFTMESTPQADIDNFQRWGHLHFPMRNGGDTTRALGVKNSPTLIFSVNQTGEFLKEDANKPYYVLDELLLAMKGGG